MRTALALLLAAAASCSPAADAAAARPPNVILICLDTVRADHLGCYGYEARATTPRLDRLASESTVFEDASATAGWTKPSVPSLLTGTYPIQHGVYEGSARAQVGKVTDVLPESATTLAEVFRTRSYATAAFVRNAQLARGSGIEQGFDTYVDEAGDAREIRWRAQDWLEERDVARPFFLYLHFLDVHWPYPVPEEYAARFTSLESVAPFRGGDSRALRDAVNDGARVLSQAELDALVALYDGSLRYVDDELARLFDWLERRGLARDTVVCVVADHGEEFMEHGRIGHGHGLYETLLSVPWILRVPGRAPQRVASPVSLVDLFPTLLAAAGIAEQPPSQGVDRLRDPGATRPVLAEHKEPSAYQQSLRAESVKLVRRFESAAGASAKPAEPPAIGTRVEVELDSSAPGGPRAREIEARGEDPDEPLEIKGVVRALGDGWIDVEGFRATTSDATELYGAVERGSKLAGAVVEGAGVKIVGALDSGRLVARRIKVYPEGEDVDAEVRGTLGAVESTRVAVNGVWIAIDAGTRWKLESSGRAAMTREDVLAIAADADPGGARARFELAERCFELRADPGERTGSVGGGACSALARGLDALGLDLAARHVWGDGDRRELPTAALDGLRELGYVR